MTSLPELWMPIVISAVVLFFMGALFWMVLPHHRSDWEKLPDEDGTINALRAHGVKGPGQFSFPHCASSSAMKDPEFMKRMQDGPSGMLVLMPPGPLNMGASMIQQVLHNAVVALVIAYAAGMMMAPGAEFMPVFRFCGTLGVLAFAGAIPMQSIWFHQKWSATWKTIFDGVMFGLVLGAIFGLLWPGV